jgi:hypothetical protein
VTQHCRTRTIQELRWGLHVLTRVPAAEENVMRCNILIQDSKTPPFGYMVNIKERKRENCTERE